MPYDIRAYFTSASKNESKNSTALPKKPKTKRQIIDSDSEDEAKIFVSAKRSKGETPSSKNEKSADVKSEYFKETKPEDIFGSEPVKRAPPRKLLKRKQEISKEAEKEVNTVRTPEVITSNLSTDDDKSVPEEKSSQPENTVKHLKNDSPSDGGKRSKIKEPTLCDDSENDQEFKKKSNEEMVELASPMKSRSPRKASPAVKESPVKTASPKKSRSPRKASPIVKESPAKTASPKKSRSPRKASPVVKESPVKTASPKKKTPVKQQSPRSRTVEQTQPVKPKLPVDIVPNKKKTSAKTEKPGEAEKSEKETEDVLNGHISSVKVNSTHNNGIEATAHRSEENGTATPVTDVKPETFSLWVDKYKPTNVKQIIGQQGEKSSVNKLLKWLKNWHSNHSGNKKLNRPSPWAKDDDGAYFKAALLSGPPGIGKTTTAHLVCKDLGFDVVEFNASDTRSKRLLHDEVSELLSTKSLSPFFTVGKKDHKVTKNHVLVMDEVDGMAGNEDRGGVQELIQLIKSSHIPIICMCNDRNHPKIRSLANYCFDLRFFKPRAEQIKGAMRSICFKEKFNVDAQVLADVISCANQDIRLIINHLCMMAAEKSNMAASRKFIKLGPWDVLRKVFSEEEHKTMSIHDKCDLFFYDYSIAPLFVQENYLNVVPHSSDVKVKQKKMEMFAKAADSISKGDLVEKIIRSQNAWSLLPVQAIFSSLVPGDVLEGHMGGAITFPSWLGKNSRQGKLDRLLQELQVHTRLRMSGSKEAMNLDYSVPLRDHIVRPLVVNGAEGVSTALSVLHEYNLVKEDLDSLLELTSWPNSKDPMSKVDSKVKAAFTRAYNKSPTVSPYAVNAPVKKKRGAQTEEGIEGEEEEIDEDEEEEEGLEADAMISVKKPTAKRHSDEPAASTSRGRGAKRGRTSKK